MRRCIAQSRSAWRCRVGFSFANAIKDITLYRTMVVTRKKMLQLIGISILCYVSSYLVIRKGGLLIHHQGFVAYDEIPGRMHIIRPRQPETAAGRWALVVWYPLSTLEGHLQENWNR